MRKSLCIEPSSLFSCCAPYPPYRQREGFIGEVKAALTEDCILIEQSGQRVEGQQASSVSAYDQVGKRLLQTPYRLFIPGGYGTVEHEAFFDPAKRSTTFTDRQPDSYSKWDQHGNLIEAGGRNPAQTRISISYEFDRAGNWIKRTVSRLVETNKQKSLQPVEVTHRHIIYFNAPADRPPPMTIPATTEQSASTANEAVGQTLFNQKCAACHGVSGNGQTEFASLMATRPADLSARVLSAGTIHSIINTDPQANDLSRAHAFKGRVTNESLWQVALYASQFSNPKSQARPNATTTPPPPPTQTLAQATKRYPFKGRIVAIERESKEVTVEHEEVQGYMGAMTMKFPINDDQALDRLKKDDYIEAVLIVESKGWRLERVLIKEPIHK